MLKSERILFQDDQSKRGWQTSTHSLLVPHAVLATAMERRGILFKVLSGGPCHFSDLSVWISSSSYLCGSSHTERSQGCLKLKHLTILRWRKRSRDMIFPSSSWFSFSKLSPMSSKWKFHLQILLTIHPWGISCVTVSASKMETWTPKFWNNSIYHDGKWSEVPYVQAFLSPHCLSLCHLSDYPPQKKKLISKPSEPHRSEPLLNSSSALLQLVSRFPLEWQNGDSSLCSRIGWVLFWLGHKVVGRSFQFKSNIRDISYIGITQEFQGLQWGFCLWILLTE